MLQAVSQAREWERNKCLLVKVRFVPILKSLVSTETEGPEGTPGRRCHSHTLITMDSIQSRNSLAPLERGFSCFPDRSQRDVPASEEQTEKNNSVISSFPEKSCKTFCSEVYRVVDINGFNIDNTDFSDNLLVLRRKKTLNGLSAATRPFHVEASRI